MNRPVEKYIPIATVKKLEFDLLQHVPADDDIEGILEAIAEKCRLMKEPKKHIVFDLTISGITNVDLGSTLSANLVMWDEIKSLKYLHPGGASLIFPIKYERE